MSGLSFAINWKALALMIAFSGLCYILAGWRTRYPSPRLYFSNLFDLGVGAQGLRTRLAPLPQWLEYAALLLFMAAFIDPRFYVERKPPPSEIQPPLATEGIAIYLLLDQSGSMTEDVSTILPDGMPVSMSKIKIVKMFTRMFIEGDPQEGLAGRPNDLIGLVEFARTAQVIVPLTLDHRLILKKLAEYNVVPTLEQEGTAIGYAVFKAVNLIVATRDFARDLIGKGKPAYEIKNSIIVLVTDGFQEINPLDNNRRWRPIDPVKAAEYAKENNIRLYIINVDPALGTEKWEANRHQMERAAQLTGGKFYLVSNTGNLADIYSRIDRIEKSALPLPQDLLATLRKTLSKDELPQFYRRISLYPYLIGLGMLCMLASLGLSTTWLRRVP